MTGIEETPAPATSIETCGGCAAKYPPRKLQELLSSLPIPSDPNLLVGLDPADDAAVYRLDDEHALVAPLDFFPPVVEDPADYGAIAAANALSDIFAMGARPLLALSIAAFPEDADTTWITSVFAAAAEQVQRAGAVLAGGHTLRDAEPKYGLAVVGRARQDEIWTKGAARVGDDLYLTKPLGTGLIVHAARVGDAPARAVDDAVRSMRTLNLDAAQRLRRLRPSAVTDVTGFGLLGHAWEMAERSNVRIELDGDALPTLHGARALAAAGVRSGGHARNLDFVRDHLDADCDDATLALALDPQTSGGLLASFYVPCDEPGFTRIGRVVAGNGVCIK